MNEITQWAPRPRCCPPPVPRAPLADPDEELALLAKALGHPARVKILRLLLERKECVCGEICDELPLAQSTVSQHLKVLREAGLIHGETDGPRVCYCADIARLESLRALIDRVLATSPVEPPPTVGTPR
jgi:ArsR family transcriptional regulator